eukprot:NODE_761_length_4440_cov_0.463257.p2 type:complete len:516 gc:universal NODE_761_length_4440_cov_0.463257:4089-2542(-)
MSQVSSDCSDEWETVEGKEINRTNTYREPVVVSLERESKPKYSKILHINQLNCALAIAIYKNSWLRNPLFISMVLSIIPIALQESISVNLNNIAALLSFLRRKFTTSGSKFCNSLADLLHQTKSFCCSQEALSMILCCLLRQSGMLSRMNFSIFPCWYYNKDIDFDLYGVWVDLYRPSNKSWMVIDAIDGNVDLPFADFEKNIVNRHKHKSCSSKKDFLCYVIALDCYNNVVDVTKRYANKYFSKSIKGVVKEWDSILKCWKSYLPINYQSIYKEESINLSQKTLNEPMPKSLSELKSHQLYVLANDIPKHKMLKKNQRIVGKVKGVDVYKKTELLNLYPKDKWMRLGKAVKENENPLSVLRRKKRDRQNLENETFTEYPLYSEEQVIDHVRPNLIEGRIPKNKYNNIEIYHPNMVPLGCVEIPYKQASAVCKELGIECVDCVIGFDYSKKGIVPVYSGVVAFEKDRKVILSALENIVVNESLLVEQDRINKEISERRKKEQMEEIDTYLDSLFQ